MAQSDSVSDLARAELGRRAAAASEAQELLKQGDAAYEKADYATAVQAYRGALDLLPANAPAVAEQRAAAIQRYSQASVERARELRRLGDLEGADAAVQAVLAEGVAPDDFAARAMEEQIFDPIRTNPASSLEHTGDVEEVRLLLYKAQGAYDLGKYDEASAVYQSVLRVDPYNTTARRGMERVDAARANYARAAYDQTRAEMLAEVDSQWEMQVPPEVTASIAGSLGTGGGVVDYIDKLQRTRVPMAVLEDVNLQEAVDFLRSQSISLDTLEPDPLRKGINFIVDVGGPDSEIGGPILSRLFSISLRNVPLSELVDYIAEQSGTIAIRQPFAVVFRPVGADIGTMINRVYNVPPDFLTSGAMNGGDAGANVDPFAAEPEDEGLLARRMTAEEKLRELGVPFPDGASASFNAGNSTLRVRNTPLNHSMVEQVVETIANEEPASIIVEFKMIKTRQSNLQELGFDWVVAPFGLGSSLYFAGGTQGNGMPINDIPLVPGPGTPVPMTSGNRSGNGAIRQDGIDRALTNNVSGSTDLRAPGIIGFNGVFGDARVAMLMRGLDQKTGTDLVSVPSVTTRSGQQASVEITREFIYPTEYEPPEIPNQVGDGASSNPVTPATPTAFDMRETGMVLEVLPVASKDRRYVEVTLKPELVEFDGFIDYGSPILGGVPTGVLGGLLGGGGEVAEVTPNSILMPVFSVTTTDTAVTVADGSTIVIGGLLEERSQKVEDKVPVFGDIPVVGRLFQSSVSAPTKSAVIFLVKVRVVDAAGRPFNP